jgi:hypothetical protein
MVPDWVLATVSVLLVIVIISIVIFMYSETNQGTILTSISDKLPLWDHKDLSIQCDDVYDRYVRSLLNYYTKFDISLDKYTVLANAVATLKQAYLISFTKLNDGISVLNGYRGNINNLNIALQNKPDDMVRSNYNDAKTKWDDQVEVIKNLHNDAEVKLQSYKDAASTSEYRSILPMMQTTSKHLGDLTLLLKYNPCYGQYAGRLITLANTLDKKMRPLASTLIM